MKSAFLVKRENPRAEARTVRVHEAAFARGTDAAWLSLRALNRDEETRGVDADTDRSRRVGEDRSRQVVAAVRHERIRAGRGRRWAEREARHWRGSCSDTVGPTEEHLSTESAGRREGLRAGVEELDDQVAGDAEAVLRTL
jgi:hypothetical protein